MKRYAAVALLYALSFSACTQSEKKAIERPVHSVPSEAMIVTQATQDRFDTIESVILEQFTPAAQLLIAQSPLYGARLKKSNSLNGRVPAGQYKKKTGVRLIDKRMFKHVALDEIMFHEMIHRCSKLINKKAFAQAYKQMEKNEWKIKQKVEKHLNKFYDPKKSDWTAEQIAYTLQFWFYHDDILPIELEEIFTPVIKRRRLFASRFAGMRH